MMYPKSIPYLWIYILTSTDTHTLTYVYTQGTKAHTFIPFRDFLISQPHCIVGIHQNSFSQSAVYAHFINHLQLFMGL